MSKDERIILAISFTALVALIIAKWRNVVSGDPSPAESDSGALSLTPLTYNQAPMFMFSPPVANVLPNSAASLGGSVTGVTDHRFYDPASCGCNG